MAVDFYNITAIPLKEQKMRLFFRHRQSVARPTGANASHFGHDQPLGALGDNSRIWRFRIPFAASIYQAGFGSTGTAAAAFIPPRFDFRFSGKHVERDDKAAKYWLDPIRLQNSGGFNRLQSS